MDRIIKGEIGKDGFPIISAILYNPKKKVGTRAITAIIDTGAAHCAIKETNLLIFSMMKKNQ